MYLEILKRVAGIYQIIYGLVFLMAGVWNVFPSTSMDKVFSEIEIIDFTQACFMIPASFVSFMAGSTIFSNHRAGFKLSIIICTINGLGDLWIAKSIFHSSSNWIGFYLGIGFFSLLLAVLMALQNMREEG